VGTVDGAEVGLNLGSVFGDESGGTPNAVIVDGHLHKLAAVGWSTSADPIAAPWSFAGDGLSASLAVDAGYVEETSLSLGTYQVDLHKPYGTFAGTARLDDGSALLLDGLRGGAETEATDW
jgi:hypothetical protein